MTNIISNQILELISNYKIIIVIVIITITLIIMIIIIIIIIIILVIDSMNDFT